MTVSNSGSTSTEVCALTTQYTVYFDGSGKDPAFGDQVYVDQCQSLNIDNAGFYKFNADSTGWFELDNAGLIIDGGGCSP